jgi:probable HAF family extracellular repeat protein
MSYKTLFSTVMAGAWLTLSLVSQAEVRYAVTDLGTLGGSTSFAYEINNSGQVVGSADTASGYTHAFLYGNGQMTDLGTLGGHESLPKGINDKGQVVGVSDTIDGQHHAFLYSNGQMTDLGNVVGSDFSIANGINDNGQVAGFNGQHAFLYSNGQVIDLGELGGGTSLAWGINNNGQVVGNGVVMGLPNIDLSIDHAFLYSNGQMTDLNTLVAPNSGLTITYATGINDSGLIAATGLDALGQFHALLLTPTTVPLPGAGWLFASAGLGFLSLRRCQAKR